MLRRRRPLLRAAMVGGAGYVAGRNLAERRQHEAAQDEEMYELRQGQAEQPAPAIRARSTASSVAERADALTKLKGLLDSGVLTQEEFDIQKRKILEEG